MLGSQESLALEPQLSLPQSSHGDRNEAYKAFEQRLLSLSNQGSALAEPSENELQKSASVHSKTTHSIPKVQITKIKTPVKVQRKNSRNLMRSNRGDRDSEYSVDDQSILQMISDVPAYSFMNVNSQTQTEMLLQVNIQPVVKRPLQQSEFQMKGVFNSSAVDSDGKV